jgi:1,2-dihydroxy-3-keto-5-methylthiopentene dioxygenase
MSLLRVFAVENPGKEVLNTADPLIMAAVLQQAGIRFEQWQTVASVKPGDSSERVLQAYKQQIDKLITEDGYQTVDVISLDAAHPQVQAKVPELRQKFLSEHRHSEDEVRFFVAGRGLFSLHLDEKVYEILCGQGDLISVPANTPHWFDMGAQPAFVAIRFFNNHEGWVAHYSGNPIAEQFSRLET